MTADCLGPPFGTSSSGKTRVHERMKLTWLQRFVLESLMALCAFQTDHTTPVQAFPLVIFCHMSHREKSELGRTQASFLQDCPSWVLGVGDSTSVLGIGWVWALNLPLIARAGLLEGRHDKRNLANHQSRRDCFICSFADWKLKSINQTLRTSPDPEWCL